MDNSLSNLLSGMIGAILGAIITGIISYKLQLHQEEKIQEKDLKIMLRRLDYIILECKEKLETSCILFDGEKSAYFELISKEEFFKNAQYFIPDITVFEQYNKNINITDLAEERLIDLEIQLQKIKRNIGDKQYYTEINDENMDVFIREYELKDYVKDIKKILNLVELAGQAINEDRGMKRSLNKHLKEFINSLNELA